MNVYAESSAVLAWLLDEPTAPRIRDILSAADCVLTSDLTRIECERAFLRRLLWDERSEQETRGARELFRAISAHWAFFQMDEQIINGSCRSFPREPIRSLDAIHLATALDLQELVPDLALMTLDERMRVCGAELNFEVLPEIEDA